MILSDRPVSVQAGSGYLTDYDQLLGQTATRFVVESASRAL
jgi:hypothetical protein